jgi:hypothetical protein
VRKLEMALPQRLDIYDFGTPVPSRAQGMPRIIWAYWNSPPPLTRRSLAN